MPKKHLNQKDILEQLVRANSDIPPQVIQTAMGTILQSIHQSLVQGRPVTLRGFGSLIPRRYSCGIKKFGLLFHPSPKLTDRVNNSNLKRNH